MLKRLQKMALRIAFTALTIGIVCPPALAVQEEAVRKVTRKVKPVYPALGKQLHLIGSVRLTAVVAPDGTVKSIKVVGGHPLLAAAATDAVRQWQYESRSKETNELLTFQFDFNLADAK